MPTIKENAVNRSMLFLLLLGVLLVPCGLQAATVTQIQSGTLDTWFTGSATLASNSQALSAAAITVTNPTFLSADCTLFIPAPSGTVTANTAVVVWLLVSTDAGATYPDGDATGITPARAPDMTFGLRAVSTAQIVHARLDQLPPGTFKVLIRNDGTGVTLNATWTLKCKTRTLQVN
jgi:hypothetical protein